MVSNESGWEKGSVLALEKHAIQGIPMRVQKPISGIRIPVERDMVTMPR